MSDNQRIADNNRMPKHSKAIITLNRVAIELKIHLYSDTMPRPAEITQELVESLEEAIRDIEQCWQSMELYY